MNKTNWRKEEEGVVFNFSEGYGVIRIITASASILEVENVAEASYKLGLFISNGIIFLLAKFGEMDWLLMPYHINPLYPYKLKDNCKYPINASIQLMCFLLTNVQTWLGSFDQLQCP